MDLRDYKAQVPGRHPLASGFTLRRNSPRAGEEGWVCAKVRKASSTTGLGAVGLQILHGDDAGSPD